MILAECPICKKVKKTYAKSFHCCNTRHNSEEFRINRALNKPSQIPSTDEGDIKKEAVRGSNAVIDHLPGTALNSQELISSKPLSLEGKQEIGFSSSPILIEPEQEQVLEPEKSEEDFNPEEDYKYKCSNCNSYFNELIKRDSGHCCPKCECDLNV